MFSTTISKVLLAVAAVLFAICIVLSIFLFISKQKIASRDATIENQNITISELNKKVSNLNLLIKHNDEIATKTIESLNSTILQCQQKQDELMAFCDKRVKLALESKEIDIAIEEMESNSGNIIEELENKIKGIDQNSSTNYIEELNKMMYDFIGKRDEGGAAND